MTDQPETPDVQKTETRLREGVERTRRGKVFLPATDIRESDEQIVLVADMPGVAPEAVDVTLEDDVLTVRGAVGGEGAGAAPAYAEYEVGDFERSFTLSGEIDRDGIEARMTGGVLTLTLPKARPQRKKIKVT
jgi:HSP20 family molecular chaperone IbpA